MVMSKPHRIIPLLLIIFFLLFPVIRNLEQIRLKPLRRTLFNEQRNIRYGFNAPEDKPRFEAIKKLQQIGSYTAVSILRDFLTNNEMDKQLKQKALIALGQLGTRKAIKSIKKFEDWSQKRFEHPLPFKFGKVQSPIDHIADGKTRPFVETIDKNEKTWAIILRAIHIDPNQGFKAEFWLTSKNENDNNSWEEPILLDMANMPELIIKPSELYHIKRSLIVQNDIIKIIYDGKELETTITGSLKDSDEDFLPDIKETKLRTDPQNPDCDNDSIPDGKDSNPFTPRHKKKDDVVEIRQAIFSILLATSPSRRTISIIDKGDFARQEYYGYSGFVLRLPETRQGSINITQIEVKLESTDTATAFICDWEGMLAASVHEAKLKKIYGKWVVVEFKMTMIS
jgi:hypothetical protein